MLVSQWCYHSGPLKVIAQLGLNGISCKIRIEFAIGHLSVSTKSIVSQIGLLEVRLSV